MDFGIPFKGLKEGKHRFEFKVTDKFFERYPDSEIQQGALEVTVDLLKRATGFETVFKLTGFVMVACDRCLDEYSYKIDYEGKLFFEFGPETEEVSDELVMLDEKEHTLDAGQYIFEFINLSLPMQNVHGTDENGKSLCNQEMIEKLNQHLVNNENDEISDPRWDKLKDLMN